MDLNTAQECGEVKKEILIRGNGDSGNLKAMVCILG